MKLTVLGCGTMNSAKNLHSNFMLTNNEGKNLLIDCGAFAPIALDQLGLSHLDVDAIYTSHCHGDHAGGIELLGFARYFDPRCESTELFISEFLVNDIWNCLTAMKCLQGQVPTLGTYFNVTAVPENGSFTWSGIKFQLVQSVHVVNAYAVVYSFGLMFEVDGEKVYITTDTQFAPDQLYDYMKESTICICDCETAPYESHVHAHYKRWLTVDDILKPKLRFTHYTDDGPEKFDAKADGFWGFVQKGQEFDLTLDDKITKEN